MKRKKQDRMVSVALLTATGPTGADKYAIEINGRVVAGPNDSSWVVKHQFGVPESKIRAALRRTP